MTEPHTSRRGTRLRRVAWGRSTDAARGRRTGTRGDRSLVWRVLVPVMFLVAGALFVTSAISADGTDLRAGRYTDLGSLLRQQKDLADTQRAEVSRLTDEVNTLSSQVGDTKVKQVQEKTRALLQPAGVVAVKGPGLSITLDDAPADVVDSADIGVDKLVVHQQDIQAVVNALWAGGAEAMTIQDQRVISTTGIKCVGNTVRLHGVPYSPPYVITAVGDPDAMLTSVNTNPYIEIYKQYVEVYQLGYQVETHAEVELPAYRGSIDLRYARTAGDTASRLDDSDL
jgi:uncharacterized protein YlxW (UPF0749 family)